MLLTWFFCAVPVPEIGVAHKRGEIMAQICLAILPCHKANGLQLPAPILKMQVAAKSMVVLLCRTPSPQREYPWARLFLLHKHLGAVTTVTPV